MIALSSLINLGCGSQQASSQRNAELTVTYNGKEILKRKPTWSGKARIERLMRNPASKTYIVLGAKWCKSCDFLRRALDQAEMLEKVEFLDIDEEWVNHLAQFYNIDKVPTMLILDKTTKVQNIVVGPGQIVVKLLVSSSSSSKYETRN